MKQKSYAERLGLRTKAQKAQAAQKAASAIKAQIKASSETVEVLGREVPCVDADSVVRSDYDFVGSGIAWWAGKLIERITW